MIANPVRPMPARPRTATATRPATNAYGRASSPTRPRRAPTPEPLPRPPRPTARPTTRPERPATRPVDGTSPLGPRSHALAYGQPPPRAQAFVQASCSPLGTIGSSPETVWPSTSGPARYQRLSNRLRSNFAQIAHPRLTSADGNPIDASEHVFDTGWVARPVLNVEQTPSIPQRPMGSIPVGHYRCRPSRTGQEESNTGSAGWKRYRRKIASRLSTLDPTARSYAWQLRGRRLGPGRRCSPGCMPTKRLVAGRCPAQALLAGGDARTVRRLTHCALDLVHPKFW
jgi:hypothetical protein